MAEAVPFGRAGMKASGRPGIAMDDATADMAGARPSFSSAQASREYVSVWGCHVCTHVQLRGPLYLLTCSLILFLLLCQSGDGDSSTNSLSPRLASRFVATPFFHVLQTTTNGEGVAEFKAPEKLGTYVVRCVRVMWLEGMHHWLTPCLCIQDNSPQPSPHAGLTLLPKLMVVKQHITDRQRTHSWCGVNCP